MDLEMARAHMKWKVRYTPTGETGRIEDVSGDYVMVRYAGESIAKATAPRSLELYRPHLECPTVPEVAAAVPVLLPPEIELESAPVAAALWVLSGVHPASGIWRHLENTGQTRTPVDFGRVLNAMIFDAGTYQDQHQVRLATEVYHGKHVWLTFKDDELPTDVYTRVLQAMMIRLAGRKEQWP